MRRQSGPPDITPESRHQATTTTDTSVTGLTDMATVFGCPDCSAATTGQHLRHDETCPQSRALDELRAADRRWFHARPYATFRFRPISQAEVVELRTAQLVDPGADLAGWRVRVLRIADDARLKRFIPPRAAA